MEYVKLTQLAPVWNITMNRVDVIATWRCRDKSVDFDVAASGIETDMGWKWSKIDLPRNVGELR